MTEDALDATQLQMDHSHLTDGRLNGPLGDPERS